MRFALIITLAVCQIYKIHHCITKAQTLICLEITFKHNKCQICYIKVLNTSEHDHKIPIHSGSEQQQTNYNNRITTLE